MAISISKKDLIGLMNYKYPEKYKKLKKHKQLDSWAEQELEIINDNYNTLMKNPGINFLEARELAMEEYL